MTTLWKELMIHGGEVTRILEAMKDAEEGWDREMTLGRKKKLKKIFAVREILKNVELIKMPRIKLDPSYRNWSEKVKAFNQARSNRRVIDMLILYSENF